MLVLVIPLVSDVLGLLIILAFIAIDILLDIYLFTPNLPPFLMVQPILLAIFYFRVRASGRTMLTLAWAYSLVFLAANGTIDLAFHFIDEEWWAREPGLYWRQGVTFLAPIIVLVWFARRASSIRFNYALMLIALSTALNGTGILMPFLPFFAIGEGWIFAWETSILNAVLKLFAVWVLARLDTANYPISTDTERSAPWNDPSLGGMQKLLSTRVLPKLDPARGMYKEAIIALLGLSCLPLVASESRSSLAEGQEFTQVILGSAFSFVYWAIWFAVIIALAYAVRVRQPPKRPATIEPTATG